MRDGNVVPGGGWVISRLDRATGEIEHVPVVGWMMMPPPMGLIPLAPLGGTVTAPAVRNPFSDDLVLWHPDYRTVEHVELWLAARIEEVATDAAQ